MPTFRSFVALALITRFATAAPSNPDPYPTITDLPPLSSILSSATDIPSLDPSSFAYSLTSLSTSGTILSDTDILSSATDLPTSISSVSTDFPTPTFSVPTVYSSYTSPTGIPIDMCDLDNLQCCAAVRPKDDDQIITLLVAFGVELSNNENSLVGVLCTNMTGGINERDDGICSGDTQMAACCSDVHNNDIFALGCARIDSDITEGA